MAQRAAGCCRRPRPAPAARLLHPAQRPQGGPQRSTTRCCTPRTPLRTCCTGRDRASTSLRIGAVVGRSVLPVLTSSSAIGLQRVCAPAGAASAAPPGAAWSSTACTRAATARSSAHLPPPERQPRICSATPRCSTWSGGNAVQRPPRSRKPRRCGSEPSLEPPLFLVAARALRRVATRAARGCESSPVEHARQSSHLFGHAPCAHLRRGATWLLNDMAEPVCTASTPDSLTMMDTYADYGVSAASMAFARPPTACVAVALPSGALIASSICGMKRRPGAQITFELPAYLKPPPCDSNAVLP